ncbi:helix-turn-helix transcriptional regulator [Aetokthonos hydrillicola Thurmond2011]|uniref:Helix-turn-helix transcriptional regulator n=1 Tax=Aetokthonos hydrillicola Thurmond2011 TaxID=2712845 RepID=A0AAP5IAB4_9CYAN|nr:helix-turn-helix transcriptional regulator [Aetokthonos hydrillicola]MBO3458418.1 helix-turn-helix transcriptional regulator [Aetokthonos hydrillicola CCALA 1050]MBW4586255.1 helix-turn-helix transcriptional regulator [Aetokthonos hydrillicola CCALA 1050]MDR9897862.1 helix-turn-helix transcriptional regulator [Aetokthonos hydrillicola Thurmond2011]
MRNLGFKLTIIRLLEEFLKERITKLDPDARLEEEIIFNNARQEVDSTFLEKYLQIPDEFWDLKYEWLQLAHKQAQNKKELQIFLNSEIQPYLDLFKDIETDKPLFISKITSDSDESDYSKSKANLKHRVGDTVFQDLDFLTRLCALRVTTELIQEMDLHNLSLSTLKNLLGGAPKPVPVTEERLREITGLPTPAPLRAGVESHYRPDKWKRDANNYGVFEAASKTNPTNRVEVFIGGEKDGDILALEAARQVIDLMGIDAAKLQLVFAAHAFNKHHLFNSKFSLKGKEIIKQIGWDKKHRLTNSEKLAELASIAFHIGRMLMQCTWVEGKPKGNKVDVSVSVSPLWVVEVDARGQKNIFTGKVDNPDEVYINVSPGPWTEKWLNRMGFKAGFALHQFGWLATEILKIDPYHDELALKLAIHLTMVSRIKVQDKNQYEHKVGTLLEAVELEARINAARQEKREAYNLKQRWDNALTLLMSMGWRVIFDDTTYPEWLKPDSQAEKPSDWKKEKIIDRLWKAKLTIKPPDPIPTLLAAKTEPLQLKPVAPTKSEPILTGTDIRKQREAKGVSQTALAEWAGKTKAWLCMVEKGKRKIGPKEAKELWAGIDFLANKSAQP